MKKAGLLFGACLLFSAGADAQGLPTKSSTTKGLTTKSLPINGYDTLMAAGKAILPGENGFPSVSDNVSPEENLRRQRVAMARNAPALALLRLALTQDIEVPIPKNYDDLGFESYALFRELERQLRQEGDVRLADGDMAGAMDSHLTGIEMGCAISHDAPLLGMLTGLAMEGVARKDIEKATSKLNATQCRDALARLKKSEARRSPLGDVLAVEKRMSISLLSSSKAADVSPQQLQLVISTLNKTYDAEIEREKRPYQSAMKQKSSTPVAELNNPLVSAIQNNRFRFSYERNVTLDLLLEGALELRAIKLESGAYPVTFDAALDPFGDGTRFIYKRQGDSYVLYSVGPDGRDDGGEELQTIEISNLTGQKTLSDRLNDNSYGDIVAPVF